jgi:hypothetical protein
MPDLPIGPQTTFRDIQQNFQNLGPKMGEKHLRLDEGRGLHLHDSGKFSGIGAKAAQARAEKHERAFNLVKESIDNLLGPGKGEEILRNVLSGKDFNNKLISVDQLKLIGSQVENAQRQMDLKVQEERSQQVETLRPLMQGKLSEDLIEDVLSSLRTDKHVNLEHAERRLTFMRDLPQDFDGSQLSRDLRSGEMGPLQALARNMVIESTIGYEDGMTIHIAKNRDDHGGLSHFMVSDPNTTVIGTDYRTDSRDGVITCKSLDLDSKLQSGELHDTGDRLHITVAPGRGESAWNTVLPIIKNYPHLVSEFSLEGDKLTLKLHTDKSGPDTDDVRKMLGDIRHDLRMNRVGPGTEGGGLQVRVGEYTSYSFEQPGKAPGNPTDQPLYQALRNR